MNRLIERWYPIVFSSLFIFIFHFVLMPLFGIKILGNLSHIISMSYTLSGIMLGFVGVMIGVVVSLNDSKLLVVIKKANANNLLKEYIKVAFYSSIGTLCVSLLFLFIGSEDLQGVPWIGVDLLVFLLILMVLTSYRMIDILFDIAGINENYDNENNLWNNKPYSPDKV